MRALNRIRFLKIPRVMEGVRMLRLFILEADHSAHISSRNAEGLDLGVGIDLITADVRLEDIRALGFVLLAFAGDAPTAEIVDLGVAIVRAGISALVPPFGPQNPDHAPAVAHNIAIVLYGGNVVIQQNDSVYVIG